MKSLFPEHFPLTENELSHIWNHGIVVFDTNVLLRFYRFKSETVKDIVKLLTTLGNRAWIPYQVAWEYNRRRATKIREAEKAYNDLVDEFKKSSEKVKAHLRAAKEFGIHPSINLEESINELASHVDAKIEEIERNYNSSPTTDHYVWIHDQIGGIYEGKIGAQPSNEELQDILKLGDERYERRCPPGFLDVANKRKANSSEQEAFGDYIIWHQILNYTKLSNLPLIFVTEDVKEDWWLREEGKTVGPLPELRSEFIRTVGQPVQFYRVDSFIKEAKKRIISDLRSETVTDVESIAEATIREISQSARRRNMELAGLMQSENWEKENSASISDQISSHIANMYGIDIDKESMTSSKDIEEVSESSSNYARRRLEQHLRTEVDDLKFRMDKNIREYVDARKAYDRLREQTTIAGVSSKDEVQFEILGRRMRNCQTQFEQIKTRHDAAREEYLNLVNDRTRQ